MQLRKRVAELEAECTTAKAALQTQLGQQSKKLEEALAKAASAEQEERKRADALEAAETAHKQAQELAAQVRGPWHRGVARQLGVLQKCHKC